MSEEGGEDSEATSDRTQMVTAPTFDAADRAWRPYTFPQLEHVTRTQRLLTERLGWMLPGIAVDGTVEGDLLARLKTLLDAELQLQVDAVHVVAPKTLERYVATPSFLAVLAPLPHKTRGLFEVELGLCHRAIDRLLGGLGEMSTLRHLTEIEEAVMSFIVLEMLKVLSPHLDPGLPRLRLEGLTHTVEDALALFQGESHVAVVQLTAVLAGQSGFIRLFLPESVLRMANAPAAGTERARRQALRTAPHIGRLAGFKAWMRVEIGHTEVSADNLAALELKSVILVDELTAFPHRGEGGTAQLKVGLGRAGRLGAEVFLEQGRFFVRVKKITLGPAPQLPGAPTDVEEQAAEVLAGGEPSRGPATSAAPGAGVAGASAGASREAETTSPRAPAGKPAAGAGAAAGAGRGRRVEESNEGVELLADIPLQVIVELARIPVTAEEVVALKVGQVFDLNRVPGEPVELSVNGKVVARGELVETQGHLGVRILSLIG